MNYNHTYPNYDGVVGVSVRLCYNYLLVVTLTRYEINKRVNSARLRTFTFLKICLRIKVKLVSRLLLIRLCSRQSF